MYRPVYELEIFYNVVNLNFLGSDMNRAGEKSSAFLFVFPRNGRKNLRYVVFAHFRAKKKRKGRLCI